MIVQWCIKGLALDSDEEARTLIDSQQGMLCNWWRKVRRISPPEIRAKLTPANLNLHVNHFTLNGFNADTPFISLSAGNIERSVALQTNLAHRAQRTALWFGTEFGKRSTAYLYTCWVVLAPRPAVDIEGVGEEVRDLNAYRRYSPFQTEGEITAKVIVPANQIMGCEKWTWDRSRRSLTSVWTHSNPTFTPPQQLSNVRELI